MGAWLCVPAAATRGLTELRAEPGLSWTLRKQEGPHTSLGDPGIPRTSATLR